MTRIEELQTERKNIKERMAVIEREYNDTIMPELQRRILANEKHDLEYVQCELKMIAYNEYINATYKEYGEDAAIISFDDFNSSL